MAKHDSFLVKHDVRPLIDNMTDEQAGALLKALISFSAEGQTSDFDDPLLSATYSMMRGHIEEHDRRYQEKCERNRENGQKGGEEAQKRRKANATENERPQANATDRKRTQKKSGERVANQADRIGLDRIGEDRILNDISSEPSPKSAEPDLELADVAAIILADGTEWRPTKAMFDTFVQAFPGVDVKAEFMKMRAWSDANPKNRKTWAGASRFANSWLAREQDRPKPKAVKRSQYDTAALEAALAWK